jgi:hypothetical protein
MKVDDAILKELFQGYGTTRRSLDRKECPSPSEMVRSFESSSPIRKKKRIVDHVSECPFCREEFLLLFEIQRSSPSLSNIRDTKAHYGPQTGTPIRSEPNHLRFWQYACSLLGLGLVISSLFLIVKQKDLSEVERTARTELILLSPKTGESVSRPLIFRWRGRSAIDYYVLELFDEALLPIWTSDKIRDIQVQLPTPIISMLRPGRSYYWMVTSYSKGSETNESRLAHFRILN